METRKPDEENALAIGPQTVSGRTFEGPLILEELRARAPFELPPDLKVVYNEEDGCVALGGTLRDESMRGEIVAIVRDVPGVRRVDDRMLMRR